MTYETLATLMREAISRIDTDTEKLENRRVFQFHVIEEGAGEFYLEMDKESIRMRDGESSEKDVTVTASAEDISRLVEGEIDPETVYGQQRIRWEGSPELMQLWKEVMWKGKDIAAQNAIHSTTPRSVKIIFGCRIVLWIVALAATVYWIYWSFKLYELGFMDEHDYGSHFRPIFGRGLLITALSIGMCFLLRAVSDAIKRDAETQKTD